MTNAKAIEILREKIVPCVKHSSWEEAVQMAISALEKQEGKKPVYNGVNYECPFCNTTIETGMKPWYCDICGQRIDWSDEHEVD